MADLVRHVGGDAVDVHLLLPSGANPHTFDPEPRTLRAAARADLFIMVGGALDPWLRAVAEGAGSHGDMVTLTRGIALEGEGPGDDSGNPHVWLDPILVRDRLLPLIRDALIDELARRGDRTKGFVPAIRSRCESYADSLTSLDREIRALLAPLRGRRFVATHPAWVYFARRYRLRSAGVIEPRPGQELSVRELADVVDSARASRVGVVFYEAQIGEMGARSLAEEIGARLVSLDPLGGPGISGRDSYMGLMRFNARQFARGLGDPERSDSAEPTPGGAR